MKKRSFLATKRIDTSIEKGYIFYVHKNVNHQMEEMSWMF